MAYAGGNPAPDLTQIICFYGQDELLLIDAGLLVDSPQGIPYAWLAQVSVAQGNAATEALASNAVVFCEPEWGWDVTGGGFGGYVGSGPMGGPSGGLSVQW